MLRAIEVCSDTAVRLARTADPPRGTRQMSAEVAHAPGMSTSKPPKQPEPALRPTKRNEENVVKHEQAKGEVRPDGPGDDSAPVKPASDKH